MSNLFVAFALVSLAVPATAAGPVIFQATNADRVTGFRTMADCEVALGRPVPTHARASADRSALRGTAFNRRAGNLSRCEMVNGEPLIVVYPADQQKRAQR